MAMRRKRNEQNGVKDGSWGYSEQSLAELERGEYGRTTGRKARYNSSSEQTRQAHELPALEGMTFLPEPTDKWKSTLARDKQIQRANQYQQNLAEDANNYLFNKETRKANTLDADDMSFLQKYYDDYGDSARMKQLVYESKRTQDWEKKYGKSLDQIYKDFVADQGNVNIEKGMNNWFKSELETAAGIIPQLGAAGASFVSNLIDPDSKFAKSAEELRHSNEVTRKQKRTGVKAKAISSIEDKYKIFGSPTALEDAKKAIEKKAVSGLETAHGLSDRALPAAIGKAIPIPFLDAVMSGLSDYNTQMEEVRNRPEMNGRQQAITAGTHAGIEGLGTALTMGILDKIPGAKGIAGKAINIGKGAGNAAAENWVSELIEQKLDNLVSGDLSKEALRKGAYMAQGMSEEQAEEQAKKDSQTERVQALKSGAMFGGLMKGASELFGLIPSLDEKTVEPEVKEQPELPTLQNAAPKIPVNNSNIEVPDYNQMKAQWESTRPGLPKVQAETAPTEAPVDNKVANETAWTNPRLIKKLEGEDLAKAQAQIESNGRQIEAIQRQIKSINENKSNYYRGNLKKAVQKDVRNLENQIRELEKSTKELNQQIKGGIKPVLDMLTKEQKDLIYDTSGKHDSVFSQINFAVKFAGDTPEAKALAKQAQSAIREFVKTGSKESLDKMTTALTELDNMAKTVNAVYKSSKGNEWTYQQAFGDQAQYLYHLQPVADIYNAERAAARAAQSAPKASELTDAIRSGEVVEPDGFVPSTYEVSRGVDSISADEHPAIFKKSGKNTIINDGTNYRAFIDDAIDTTEKNINKTFYLGKVNNELGNDLNSYLGEDFEGNHILTDSSHVWHAYKKHGPESKAAKNGEIPITREDLESALEAFNKPDDCYWIDDNDIGQRQFKVQKRIDGYIYTVFAVKNGKATNGDILIADMYKSPTALNSGKPLPSLTSETAQSLDSSPIIPSNSNSVNEVPELTSEPQNPNAARLKEIDDTLAKIDEKILQYGGSETNTDVEKYHADIRAIDERLERLKDGVLPYEELVKSSANIPETLSDLYSQRAMLQTQFDQIQDGMTTTLPSGRQHRLTAQELADQRANIRYLIKQTDNQIVSNTNQFLRIARETARNNLENAGATPIEDAVSSNVRRQLEETKKKLLAERRALQKGNGKGKKTPANTPNNENPTITPSSVGGNVPPIPPQNNNFSLVGDPYTPQEVPNVKPTPPTTPPPTQEVPNMGGTEKTSQYYKNTMRGTETNRDMSDEEYAKRFNEEIYKRMTIPEQQSVSQGQKFIEESGGNEAAIQRLLSGDFDSEERFSGYHIDAAEMLANDIERQALELEARGEDASQLWRTANRLHKKIQLNASDFGVGMQALKKWKRSTPQGAYDDLITQINKGIDKKKTTGYSRKVENLSDKVVDAVENTEDKSSLIQKIKDIFAKDRENNPYNTQKAEQLVLDLVGGDKNTKMSIADLADEASRLIKKEMGTSTLTPKEERAILNLLDAASKLDPGTREYNVLVSRAMTIVDDSLPSSFGEKFKSLLYDNMLASIKTMFTRNFGGNVVGNAIDAMAAPFQVGADALVGKFTGERTRVLTGKSIVEAAKGLGHGFKDWGQDIGYSIKNKTLLNTPRSGQESLADVLHAVHKTWKTQSNNKVVKGIHNALATYDYIIRKGMEGGDRPIYEAQYAATQAELYHLVDKYGDKGLRKGLPADKRDVDTDDLIDMIAINEALEAVLQNDSKMKEAAKNIKAFFRKASEDMVGIDVASMSHAPFVEVPANMASNFFKLTPVGWVGNINRTIGEKRKYGSINQRRFTGELGLNVLGGLMGAGLFAVANKIISDKYSEDKDEKKLQQNNGYQEYALQAPDESWQADISDIPYLGAMMKYAKMERDAYNEDGVKGALSALGSSIGAATVDTLYQSLNRLTGADFQYNGSGNLVGNAINNIKSSVGSMGVPSWLRQTAQFTDPYKRDLGDYGSDEYNKNLIINGIPGLRQTMLDPKIDTAGQPVPELGGATGFNRFMSAYINPWKISHPHENTSAVQEYANMLKQATEGKVNPQMKVVNKSDITKIKGYDAENYSHKDLREFQEDYYKSNTEYGNALINDPWFTNLSYEKQGELLDELWKANKALCQENFVRKGKTPEEIEAAGDELYTTDNKLAGILRDDDENHTGLIQWLKDETARDEINEKYGTNMSHDKYVDFNSRGDGYAEQRASEADKAKALGMTVDNYEKYESEYPGGAQARYDDANAAREYGFVNTDKTVNLDAYNIAKELGDGDPSVMQAYADYKKQGIKSNAYGDKADYLFNDDTFTDEQKGMIIAGSQDGSKLGNVASGARGMYEAGGNDYAGIYYYYLLKNMADTDGSGRISKDERKAFFENDNPYLDELWQLSQDMYTYLQGNLK